MSTSRIISNNFTQGGILKPLLRFSLPILDRKSTRLNSSHRN